MLTQSATIHMLSSRLAAYETDIARGAKGELLRAEVGIIGELYVAMMTRGQLADQNNQPGHDVISEAGERISVKTTQRAVANMTFNPDTFDKVDRVVVVKVENTDEQGVTISIAFDATGEEMTARLGPSLRFSESSSRARDLSTIPVIASAEFDGYRINQHANASISLYNSRGAPISVVKPVLRELAEKLGVDPISGTGVEKNTRSLGDHIIKAVKSR